MTKSVRIALALLAAWTWASGTASAAKVNIPKEGRYAFDFCPVGHGKTLSGGSNFVLAYEIDAITRSTPPDGPFDRMGARCYGIYKNIQGTPSESGVCEMTDIDGDKWWMNYQGDAAGKGGAYKAVWGSGKYEGATIQGEYRLDNNWGSPAKEVAFVGCNPNQGSYKLR